MTELVREHDAGIEEGVAVVFVHGMEGERRQTWMHDPASPTSCWPQWLGMQAACDTWTAGYDAGLATWRDTGSALHVNGLALMDKLATEPELAGRPLILIGHDVGGLLLKKAMVQGMRKGAPRHKRMVDRIRGLGFIATPQSGEQMNLVAKALCLRQGAPVWDKDFATENAHMRALQDEFARLCSQSTLQAKVFAEEKAVTVGRKWFGLLKVRKIAVPFDAAYHHVPSESLTRLSEDHFSISKPDNAASPLHQSIVSLINACKAMPLPVQAKSVAVPVQIAVQQAPVELPIVIPNEVEASKIEVSKIVTDRPARIQGTSDGRLQPCENKLYGRDRELTRVLTFLDSGEEAAAVVSRAVDKGGIGKTELCKAALKLWLSRDAQRKVFFIPLSTNAGQKEFIQALGRGIGIDTDEEFSALATDVPAGLYYLDNLGEFAVSEDGLKLLTMLKGLPGVRLLISSRCTLPGDVAQIIEIDALPKQAALNLFRDLWSGGDVLPVDTALAQFVEVDLQRHALSICLLARLGDFFTYDEVVIRWRKERAVASSNDNLGISLELTRQALSAKLGALDMWKLVAGWPGGIAVADLQRLEASGQYAPDTIEFLRHHRILERRGDRFYLLGPLIQAGLRAEPEPVPS